MIMRRIVLSTAFGLVATCFVWLPGCGKGTTNLSGSGATTAPHSHSHDHGHSHDHAHAHGPNGGHLLELGAEDYHAELTYDESNHRVGIHMLGGDATTAAPIDTAFVEIFTSVDGDTTKYSLPAVPQTGEQAGKSSYFELESEPLGTIVSGQSPAADIKVRLNLLIDGLPYAGTIDPEIDEHPPMGLGHVHGEDHALVWQKEISDQGYDIHLGHHASVLLAGAEVEPAVEILQAGKPIADAQVFNSLLAADGETVLAEEVATVYEPPTDDEPAHYAQGGLKIPPGTRDAVLRYRIVLPEGKGERTIDVPVAVQ
jgi:hypothetical protein